MTYFIGLNSQISQIDNKTENIINYNVELKATNNNLITLKRIIFKSLIETFWSGLKEIQNHQKIIDTNEKTFNDLIKEIDLYEFGKIYSNLCLEEFIPNLNSSKKQKLIELVIPTLISYFVINFYIKKIINNKQRTTDSTVLSNEENLNKIENNLIHLEKLIEKLATKLLNANLLQTKNDPLFAYIKPVALTASFYKHDKAKTGFYKFFNLYVGIEKILLNSIKNLMRSNIIKVKKPLNKKHYKKAFAKTIQTIIKPFIHQGIFLFEDKIENNNKET